MDVKPGHARVRELAVQAQFRAFEHLNQAVQRFETLARSSEDLLVGVDPAGRVRYLSPAWLRVSKRPLRSCLGQPIEAILSAVPDNDGFEDTYTPAEARHPGKALLATTWTQENGDELWKLVPAVVAITPPSKNTSETLASPSQKTEQDGLDWLQERIDHALWRIAPDGTLADFNGFAANLAGEGDWRVGQLARPMLLACGLHPETLPAVLGKGELIQREWPSTHRSGRILRVCARARKTTEDRWLLVRLLEGESEISAVREAFLTALSHEMKTPLTSIRGFSELLLEDDSNPQERQRMLRYVVLESQRLEGHIEELLDLAQVSSDLANAELRPTEVVALVWKAVFEVHALARSRGVELLVEDAPQGILAEVDARLWTLAIESLLRSSVGNSERGQVVRVRLIEKPRSLCLQVIDQGHRGEAPTTDTALRSMLQKPGVERDQPGSGRSLAIAESVIQAHGGQLRTHRSEQGGLVIEATLPKQS